MGYAKMLGISAVTVIGAFLIINLGIQGIGVGVNEINNIINDANYARVEAFHYNDDDQTLIMIFFTNDDGDYVKADGSLHLEISKENDPDEAFFSTNYSFSKDDFRTWPNALGVKLTAYVISYEHGFGVGEYVVKVTSLELADGRGWDEMKTSFWVYAK